MPRTERSKQSQFSFALTPENIREIDRILGHVSDDRAYSVRCSDHSVIQFQDLDDLLIFPNTKFRKIYSLTISAGDYLVDFASVEFDANAEGDATAKFSVKGDDDMVVLVSNRIEEQVLRTKQWYTPLAGEDISGHVFFVALVGAFLWGSFEFVSWWANGFPRHPVEASTEPKQGGIPGGVILFFIVGTLFLAGLGMGGWKYLQKTLFPKGEFAIGDGAARISGARFWRRFLGTSVLVALGVSLLSTFLWNFIPL